MIRITYFNKNRNVSCTLATTKPVCRFSNQQTFIFQSSDFYVFCRNYPKHFRDYSTNISREFKGRTAAFEIAYVDRHCPKGDQKEKEGTVSGRGLTLFEADIETEDAAKIGAAVVSWREALMRLRGEVKKGIEAFF